MKVLALIPTLAVGLSPFHVAAQAVPPLRLLDNPSVRVEVLSLPPGVGSGQHQGIEPEVGIVVEGQLTLDSPLAHEILQPGKAYWLPGLIPHDVRNEGDRPARMFAVLLKRCD